MRETYKMKRANISKQVHSGENTSYTSGPCTSNDSMAFVCSGLSSSKYRFPVDENNFTQNRIKFSD